MDSCFLDVTVEFFSVAFHAILFYGEVYPKSVFETRRKYGVVVYRCIHPEVNQYIDLCLKSITECLKTGQLSRIELAITDNSYRHLVKFIIDISKNEFHCDTIDAYLVQAEQNLRAFFLNLAALRGKFAESEDDRSFAILLHTNESTAVEMASNPDFDEFPLVEVGDVEEMKKIVPLQRFSIRNHNLDTYMELK